jgi:hypothetical protein
MRDGECSRRGFNLFAGEDLAVFQALLRGEFNISGFQNKHLVQWLQKAGAPGFLAAQLLARPWADQKDRLSLQAL